MTSMDVCSVPPANRKWILLDELKHCGKNGNLQRGKAIHAEATENGYSSCIYFGTALVNMYAKCRSMADAREVFDGLKDQDVVLWTALILGYAYNGEGVIALDLFEQMKARGCEPDSFAFVAALKACTSLVENGSHSQRECLERVKRVHSNVGSHLNTYVSNTLIDFYAKCGSMTDARKVFECTKRPSIVSWNALIGGYADNGDGLTGLDLFARMRSEGIAPSKLTFVLALKACTSLALDETQSGKAECLERGKDLHSLIGDHSDMYVQNTLINMYIKCGSMAQARQIFEGMKCPDVVSWTALILGYAVNGESITSLDLFARLKTQACAPNSLTYVAVLKACGSLGALDCGKKIHEELDTVPGPTLVTALVDFYAKCGDIVAARRVFRSHPRARDVTTWSALLGGYSRVGEHEAAFHLFKEMQDAGFQPNGVTYLFLLMCCTHAGLVSKGKDIFAAMVARCGVTPTVQHYTCLVDMLGRSNKLDDAMALLQAMPYSPNVVTWMTVLSAARKWKNVGLGSLAFMSLLRLDEANVAAHVLMAHLYGSRGLWKEQEMVLAMKNKST